MSKQRIVQILTSPEITYLYDAIYKLGVGYSVTEIDSITATYLKDIDINNEYFICIVNPKTGEIYKKSKMLEIPRFGIVKSGIIPTRLDLS